ncbi:hypothetical protein GCM10009839_69920 [Catenulispora yoronensis]|uniref:Uncharacterized protein n=1 Tax=Catenulispora yoronensis TaxID=450799 RepID=A0ABN2V5J1_9ACTN
MRTLIQDLVPIAYGQLYVESEHGDEPQAWESMGGQQNGLLGAAIPGALFLITGTHTGRVPFTVELHDAEPPLSAEWEEVVEAPFHPLGRTVVVTWGDGPAWELELADIDYRVRYSASGMDEAKEHELLALSDDPPVIDRYLLQFWPAPPAPDSVVRRTSQSAAYWHDHALRQPAPPTPEEKAEAERVAAEAARAEQEQRFLEAETRNWGGRLPSDRVRALPGQASAGARLDGEFADSLAAAGADEQARVARWIARRALGEARLDRVDWISEALDGLDGGGVLQLPSIEDRVLWDRLWSEPGLPNTVVTTMDGRVDNFRQQAAAFPALLALRASDPLIGALEALWAAGATFGHGRTAELLSEVRAAFPEL